MLLAFCGPPEVSRIAQGNPLSAFAGGTQVLHYILPGGRQRGRCTAAPTTLALVPEALAARALYLDALWDLLYSGSLHGVRRNQRDAKR